MTTLRVQGGRPLSGRITPSANKNSVLPVLCASLLTHEPVLLRRVPPLTDVIKILDYFRAVGSEVEADFGSGVVRIRHPARLRADLPLPAGIRSAVMLVPGLLQRCGRAALADESKGCTLGVREIDPHIEVFRGFGCEVATTPAGVVLTAPRVARPMQLWLDYVSVTTTENFLMCAVLAAGASRLVNAACEPHVQEVCRVLADMGGEISGIGSTTLCVEGRPNLGGIDWTFQEDHHEVATLLALGAISGGQVSVRNGAPHLFGLIDRTFAKFGVAVTHLGGWSHARLAGAGLRVALPFTPHLTQKVEAAPWPYIPADLLPIFIALGVRAQGETLFWNKVYEGGLGWTTELAKFGARTLACDPHRMIVFGGQPLAPAEVESPYIIRAAIALLMLATSIEGVSRIHHADPIRRAHPNFVENLRTLGADIDWEDEPARAADERLREHA